MNEADSSSSDAAVLLRDLNPLASRSLTAAFAQHGPALSPRKIIQTYDADEWEIFIEEWATSLRPRFSMVRRFGGSGDKGVDVAGFHSERGFEAAWECFQGKFYGKSLTPSTAWPEILKIFLLEIDNETYTLPNRYYFLAPKGVGTGLGHLLSSPTKLRDGFLKQLSESRSQPFALMSAERKLKIEEIAKRTDFSLFTSVEVRDLIEDHKTTPYFVARFGGGLPSRPTPDPAPDHFDETELIYLQKLINAYVETYQENISTLAEVVVHSKAGPHLQRQREAFFRAESLKQFARDSVPPGTFAGLQQEILDAVIETVEADHTTGLERLRHTLDRAVSAQLSANALIQVTEPADRKGICHHLANDDKLSWVETE